MEEIIWGSDPIQELRGNNYKKCVRKVGFWEKPNYKEIRKNKANNYVNEAMGKQLFKCFLFPIGGGIPMGNCVSNNVGDNCQRNS